MTKGCWRRGGGHNSWHRSGALRVSVRIFIPAIAGKVCTMSVPSSEVVNLLDSYLIRLLPRSLLRYRIGFVLHNCPQPKWHIKGGAQQLKGKGECICSANTRLIETSDTKDLLCSLVNYDVRRHWRLWMYWQTICAALLNQQHLADGSFELSFTFPSDGRQTIVQDLHTCLCSLHQHMRGRNMCPRSLSHSSVAMGIREGTKIQHHSKPISKIYFVFILLLLIFTPRVDSSWWWVVNQF